MAMPTFNLGLNGFGIMGRIIYRLLSKEAGKEAGIRVTKINDLAARENLEYLLQHDSVHGRSSLTLQGVEVTAEKEIGKLDWSGIDVVIDATPHLRSYAELSQHVQRGAKYVLRTSPLKGSLEKMQTILWGVNDSQLDLETYQIFSLASCTTNCLAPLVKVVMDHCRKNGNGNEEGNGNGNGNEVKELDFVTVHAYTADQLIKDGVHKADFRRGRGVDNIIESETGASSQIVVIFPELQGKIFGSCYRVPVADGSVLELRVKTKEEISVQAINEHLRRYAAEFPRILSYETASLVSADCLNDPHSALYLAASAEQLTPHKIKLVALYDNEFGYCNRVFELIKEIKKQKFDPIIKQFQEYEQKASINTWAYDSSDRGGDSIITMSELEVYVALQETAKMFQWDLQREGEGIYHLTAPDFKVSSLLKFYRERDTLTLYDQQGQIPDLAANKEPEKNAAATVQALIEQEISDKLAAKERGEWPSRLRWTSLKL